MNFLRLLLFCMDLSWHPETMVSVDYIHRQHFLRPVDVIESIYSLLSELYIKTLIIIRLVFLVVLGSVRYLS